MPNYDRSKLEGKSGFDLFMFETFDDPDNIKNKIFGLLSFNSGQNPIIKKTIKNSSPKLLLLLLEFILLNLY